MKADALKYKYIQLQEDVRYDQQMVLKHANNLEGLQLGLQASLN